MTVRERQAWRSTFGTQDGKAVLADMLNRLGFYADDPASIKPELIAVANWMLGRLGTRTMSNLASYTEAIIDCGGLQDTSDRPIQQQEGVSNV